MKKIIIPIVILLVAAVLIYTLAPGWVLQSMANITARAGGFDKETIDVEGYTGHFFDNNREDKPVMVMLHGFADRKESWFPFANRFSKDYRIILPDAVGHGDNLHDDNEEHTFARQAEFIDRSMHELKIDSFHLVGISMGGAIAGKFAVLYPGKVQSLTFISSAGMQGCDSPSALDLMMDEYSTAEEKAANFPLLPTVYDRANAQLFKKYIFYKKIFAPNRLFKQYMMPVIIERDFYIDVLDDFVDIKSGEFLDPLDDDLAGIHCPVMVIWGQQDPLLDVSCTLVLATNLPEPPQMVLIDECGHATIVEQPRKTYEALRGFLDQF